MLSVRFLSVLSVTLVYCGQTVAWIKVKFGMQVALCPGHIVLDGDLAPSPKGTEPPIFGPYLLWPNGWMDQMPLGMEIGVVFGASYLDRLSAYQVAFDPSSHFATTDMGQKLGALPLWGRGARTQSNTIWSGSRPRRLCVRWGHRSPSQKGRSHQIFGPFLLWPNG